MGLLRTDWGNTVRSLAEHLSKDSKSTVRLLLDSKVNLFSKSPYALGQFVFAILLNLSPKQVSRPDPNAREMP